MSRRRRRRRLLLHGGAVLSAVLASLAWPPADLEELAWLAWTPWLAALVLLRPRAAEASLSGAVHLTTVHLVNCWWFVLVLHGHGGVPTVLAVVGTLLSAVIGPLPYGFALGAVAGLLTRRRGLVGLLGLPFAWAAIDALRTMVPISGAWALPAYTQAGRPEVLGIAEWFGAHGLTAVLLLGNVALLASLLAARAALRKGGREALAVALVAGALVAASLVQGRRSARAHEPSRELLAAPRILPHVEGSDLRLLARIDSLGPAPPPLSEDRLRVALVQGSAPQEILIHPARAQDFERARRQLALSALALAQGIDLLVWSESSHPATAGRMPSLLADLRRLLERAGPGPEAVVGVVIESQGERGEPGFTNSVVLVGPEGLRGRYDKRILVPFGEYVPAARVFFWAERLAGTLGSGFLAGREARTLPGRRAEIGASVCYEAAFPREQRALVRAGAELLVNVTNDGWYHGSPAPEQHLRFSVLRAVENRRWVVRCANSGVSAVVAPNGRIVARLGEGERGVLLAQVERRRGLTLFARVGDLPLFAAGLLSLAWALGSGRRRSGPSAAPGA